MEISTWKKGYILAGFVFYHNVLHRLKVLAPKHRGEITLSSRAARKKKDILKVFHLNWHAGVTASTEEDTPVLQNSVELEEYDK